MLQKGKKMPNKTKKYETNAERQAAYRARKAAQQPETAENGATVARGRPKQYATAAERQAAYRARLKERGLRVVSHVVRDVRDEQPLRSDVIDLSEVRQRR